ncbi:hypothetical protein [Paraferrimonas haliotis]|uniref:Uncharacterized protein n=1 Tax=Paraferrimonas haliotis TaxID=2013866 RepID=A0AA37WXR7_9GAMM|nr:hypothetical protein [Paraferrimonas haliotis]GLS82071.1 hypothetical protein GCM10007894_00480 [Paraferrimonas haliotis]
MKLAKLMSAVVGLCLSSSALALSESDFNRIEHHINTGVGKTLPYATNSRTAAFENTFDFMTYTSKQGHKLVTYLDTPDMAFDKAELIIRVRENVANQTKTKITVKLRGANPEAFGAVSNYRKAEIDITAGKNAYGVSWDIPYSSADIDVKNVDVDKVFATIRAHNRAAYNLVKDIYEANKGKIIQTEVMRALEWEGQLKDSRFDSLEVEFAYWTPLYRKPRIYFGEFNFKGHASNSKLLAEAAAHIEQEVERIGLLEGMHTGSKTGATFKLSKGFNK